MADDPRTGEYYQALLGLSRMVRGGASWSGQERNVCLLNTADGAFAEFSAASGFDFLDDARAIGLVDWDGDGDQDLWLKNHSGPQVRVLDNRWPAGGHSLAVRLSGKRSNRDGIGARLEVDPGDGRPPLVRSLRAGEGFLAQASKWVHFGLGPQAGPVNLTIRWPSGVVDRIADLPSGHRYTVSEGSGRAEPFTTADRPRTWSAEPLAIEPARPAGRATLPFPTPLPELRYRDAAGKERTVRAAGRPVWIQLWAGWCRPCLDELQQTVAAGASLQRGGVDVLALNLETAGPEPAVAARPGEEILARLGWSQGAGWASPLVVEKLELWARASFAFDRPLALPTSLLIDPANRLVAVYRGPATPADVLADAATGGAAAAAGDAVATGEAAVPGDGGGQTRPRGLPFTGRWLHPPGRAAWLNLAQAFRQAGFRPDARRYYEAALAQAAAGEPSDESERQTAEAALVELTWEDALDAYGAGQIADAEALLRRVLELRPGHVEAEYRLGRLAAERGDEPQAVRHYRAALAGRSDHLPSMAGLGHSLLKLDEIDEAFLWFGRVLAQAPESPDVQAAIAWTLATHADPARRNARDAVMLAENLCLATGYRHYPYLDALAAAYAERGDFAQARDLADRALALAEQAQATEAAAIRARAELYRAGQPYREPPVERPASTE